MDFLERVWRGGEGTFSQRLKRNPGQALIEAEEIITLAPDNASGWCLKGMALLELDRLEEALRSFDKAIKLRPDLAEAWHGRGSCLLRLQNYREALAALEKAPHLYSVCYQKGCALGSLGRYNEAMDALQEAIRLNHDDQEVLNRSRSLLEEMAKRREAPKASNVEGRALESDHISPHTYNSPA
jgi:tetratricopeptide (TPR) repeat protein